MLSNGYNPNSRVRIAVVGTRRRGREHVLWFHRLAREENLEIAALCDVDEAVLGQQAAEYEKLSGNKARLFTDIRKLLEDKTIDAVSYATPNHWHALGTIWACQAGKDVFLEKPASHTIFEGRKMIEAARKYRRIVQHGAQSRSNPAMQEGVAKLREGVIGEVYMARGFCFKWRDSIGRLKEEPVPSGVHYDLWIGPAPRKPFARQRFHEHWHFLWDYGNGEIANQGAHQLDIMRWGLGLDTHPTEIQSMGGHYVHNDHQETPNTQVAWFRYQGRKLLLQFDVRPWMTNLEAGIGDLYPSRGRQNLVGVIFFGSEGYMVMPGYTCYYTFLGKNRTPGPKQETTGDPAANPDHFRNFIRAVRSRKQTDLTADIAEGHLSAALSHLANISYRTGRALRFDPRAERFPGDEEANRLLTRGYRPPFVVPEEV
ncbi:MAG: Gfo/Idh/MocA family oxidoreductase [Acidobacteria bacterium]|nr:Gfo/Idh/MocA family oxidoreductase [Acidobacteriota bacterium]